MCFRPLSGTVFPKFSKIYTQKHFRQMSFRPLSGTVFPKYMFTVLFKISNGFRPLSGTVFPKYLYAKTFNTDYGMFPSPLGDCIS